MRRWLTVLIVLSTAGAAAGRAPQGSPRLTVADVVARASRFAEAQRDTLVNVRADEDYVQTLQFTDGEVLERRRLESEMAFVQLSDSADWLAFRSVLRVDEVATGTDPARLEKLFRGGSSADQGRRIAEENAIHNLGRLHRTFNIPTVVPHLLLAKNHPRFRFSKAEEEDSPEGRVWVLDYNERDRPTIIRALDGGDVPVRGRLWVIAADGRLIRATLYADEPVRSGIEFVWGRDANLKAWVPVQMREQYLSVPYQSSGPRNRRVYDIMTTATYANYRRFDVDFRIVK
jgi:hypothetical protein